METVTVNFPLRPAKDYELKDSPTQLRRGLMYFLKSTKTGKFDGPYYIEPTTDIDEFTYWFKAGMIYIAESPLTSKVEIVNP